MYSSVEAMYKTCVIWDFIRIEEYIWEILLYEHEFETINRHILNVHVGHI